MQHLLDPTSIAAYATALLAIGTLWMATETRRLARESRQAVQWTDYQHQESLTPILKLEPADIRIVADTRAHFTATINNRIVNRGSGPAIEVTFKFLPPDGEPKTWNVSPLGIGDGYDVQGVVTWTGTSIGPPPSQARIDYKNLFRQVASTTYIVGDPRTFYSGPARFNRLGR